MIGHQTIDEVSAVSCSVVVPQSDLWPRQLDAKRIAWRPAYIGNLPFTTLLGESEQVIFEVRFLYSSVCHGQTIVRLDVAVVSRGSVGPNDTHRTQMEFVYLHDPLS